MRIFNPFTILLIVDLSQEATASGSSWRRYLPRLFTKTPDTGAQGIYHDFPSGFEEQWSKALRGTRGLLKGGKGSYALSSEIQTRYNLGPEDADAIILEALQKRKV